MTVWNLETQAKGKWLYGGSCLLAIVKISADSLAE
jgi:hypothetical protein